MRVVLHNHLFQVEEGALVMHTLSELNLGAPCVRSVGLLAIIALQVLYDELNLESLLQKRVLLDLLLYCQLDFDPARMRLRPDKRRV